MTAEPGIRDAVRQLGRAVGTLVRAVVGTVGRRTPVTAARTESGPPQEWLDLVAETDPDWLARSAWADRGRRGSSRPRAMREPEHIEPEWDSDDESSARPITDADQGTGSADHPSRSGRKLTPRQARGTTAQAPRTTAQAVRTTEYSVPELVEGSMSSFRTPRRRDQVHPAQGRPSRRAGDSVAGAPQGAEPTPEPAEGFQDPVRSYVEPVRSYVEPVRSYVEPVRSTDAGDDGAGRLSERVLRPAPDLERYEPVPAAPERSRRAGVHLLSPDRPGIRPAHLDSEAPDRPERGSPWPELPRTDTLDDPTPGLAAQLWLADRPDTLTTAQRRS